MDHGLPSTIRISIVPEGAMTTDFRPGNAPSPFFSAAPLGPSVGSSADTGRSNGGGIRAEASSGLRRLVRIFR
jgi:hypothetical protein